MLSQHRIYCWLSGLLALLFVCFILPYCIYITPTDRKQYTLLMQESHALHSKSAIEEQPIKQRRIGVCKHLWRPQRDRLANHFHIASEGSQLTLTQKKRKVERQEWLEEVHGSASHDAYTSRNSRIGIWDSVKVAQNRSEGMGAVFGQPPSLSNNFECFDAAQMPILKSREVYTFCATSGYTDGNLLFLEGDIHCMFEQDGNLCHTIADAASWNPTSRRMILESLPPTRVLVEQEKWTLSAPRIEIGKSIEGKGDVHFVRKSLGPEGD